MSLKKSIFLLFLAWATSGFGQVDFMNSLSREQVRIDGLDGKVDSFINIGTSETNKRANDIYRNSYDKLEENLFSYDSLVHKRNQEIVKLLPFIKAIEYKNYDRLSYYEKSFKILNALYDGSSDDVLLAMCKSYSKTALSLVAFFKDRPFAEDFLLYTGKKYPHETLGASKHFPRAPYLARIVKSISYADPHSTKQFLGTSSPVSRQVKKSEDRLVKKIYEIFEAHGLRSNSYVNIDALINGRLSLAQSETLNENKSKHLNWLIEERMRPNILGALSIERRLEYLAHLKVEDVNELHDNPNEAVRFRSVRNADAKELYTLMVYTQEEIYTSSFLGLYKRFKTQLNGKSGFQFLKEIEFNKFRTFIKECAGFNTLDDFFKTMSLTEKDSLLDLVIDNLDENQGEIQAAVEVADIFGSLTDTFLASTYRHKIYMEYLKEVGSNDAYGQFIYGLLYKLCNGDNSKIIPLNSISFKLPDLTRLAQKDLFKDGQNIQQHLFFDDKDGQASYNSFLNSFRNDANWRIVDQPNYICIKSRRGLPVLIFANKPSREAQGQEELAALFASLGRYPDIAVHRGHSYYVDGTIDIMNQSTKIAILGACGSYKMIAKAIQNSEDVQIVSTKQIGTMTVNDVLIKDLAEVLRKGNTLDWKKLWIQLENKLKNNEKFYDYIPPYKNLGAMYIKAYRLALESGELNGII
jgi:hypothetical protein